MTKNEDDKNRIRFRKQNSGAHNRRVKGKKEELEKSLIGSISSLFQAKIRKSQCSTSNIIEESSHDIDENVEINEAIDENEIVEANIDEDVIGNRDDNVNEEDININRNDMDEGDELIVLDLEKDVDFNYDPGLWGRITDTKRIMLVKRGPIKISKENDKFPKNEDGRHFSSKHERKWLVYSNEVNKVFCFCCKLFKSTQKTFKLGNEGVNDWHNISAMLREHENNSEHISSLIRWVDLHKGLQQKTTIDKRVESLIEQERQRWKKVLVRIIGVVKTLSRNNLPFRGSNEKIYEKNNGLFCQLVEFVADFDPIMEDHLRRVVNNEINNHYLSHSIQNELILLLAKKIKEAMLVKVLKAKYYSIILDCTPDLSHKEQMSIIIRCVDVEDDIKVEEFFLGFIEVDDTSGLGLFKKLESVLNDLKLNIDDVRGQSYDNGSNMKGKHQGVQKRLLDINPRAIYISCGCHSLNLALCDMAKSCVKARSFFAYVQKIYTLFSDSTHRWEILRKYVNGLTPKALSATRWESHIESVRAIRTQPSELRDALIDIENNSNDDMARVEAKGLCQNALEDFAFLISLCVWYTILDNINRVSKILQREEMDIEDAIIKIKELIAFFEIFREKGYESMINEARELADEVGIEPKFAKKRVVRRKKQFNDDVEVDANETQSLEENFRITYFLHIIDQALTSLKDRFEQFELYEGIYGFLLNAKFKTIDDKQLKEHCMKLEVFLKHNEESDICGKGLYFELTQLRRILPSEITKSTSILDFLRSYRDMSGFLNVWIVFRIILTIPVTVASAERSFSKLKLIKTYLRTTMSQERLSGLAMISIEKDYLDMLEYDDIIDEFASKNSRRSCFR